MRASASASRAGGSGSGTSVLDFAEHRVRSHRITQHTVTTAEDDGDDEHDSRVPFLLSRNPRDGLLQNPWLTGDRTIRQVITPE